MRAKIPLISPYKIRWPRKTTVVYDVVTAAPQRLYRYLVDEMDKRGYTGHFKGTLRRDRKLRIVSLPIANTASVEGVLFRRRAPEEKKYPWVYARIVGYSLLSIGLIVLLLALLEGGAFSAQFYSSKSLVSFLQLYAPYLLISIFLIVVGVVLMGLNEFIWDSMWIGVSGEVYGSTLGAGTKLPEEYAQTSRSSMIGELHLKVYGASVHTKNKWKGAVVTKTDVASKRVRRDFNLLLASISEKILPNVRLQKSWEQVQQEFRTRGSGYEGQYRPPPPPPPEHPSEGQRENDES